MKLRIFISSVQKEFAEERRLLKRYISKNPAYRRLFDTFVFEEDVVAADRRTDEVYLDELRRCNVYIGLVGSEYGFEDSEGVSPTEREYDEATRLGINPAIKKEDLFTEHPSCPNNALIADQLYQVKYIEKFGTGFTDLLDGCKSAGLLIPDVVDDGAWFTLTIWRKGGKGSQKGSQKILEALRRNPNMSTTELAGQIGISRRAVAKHVAALQASGALRRIGPDRGGYWEVVCE